MWTNARIEILAAQFFVPSEHSARGWRSHDLSGRGGSVKTDTCARPRALWVQENCQCGIFHAPRGILRGTQGYYWRSNNRKITPISREMRRELEQKKLENLGFRVFVVKGRHHRACSVCNKDKWENGDRYVYRFPYVEGSDKYCLECALKTHCRRTRQEKGRKCSVCKQLGHNSRTCNQKT